MNGSNPKISKMPEISLSPRQGISGNMLNAAKGGRADTLLHRVSNSYEKSPKLPKRDMTDGSMVIASEPERALRNSINYAEQKNLSLQLGSRGVHDS